MKKHLTTLTVLLGMATVIGQTAVFATDAYELDKKANKLDAHAVNNATKAAAEESESSTDITEGKKGSAALHARKAAKEQGVANKYAKEASKVKEKAAEKAVKETY